MPPGLTMEKVTVKRAFMNGREFVRPGAVITAETTRANDLERSGLVTRAGSKAAPTPDNKRAPDPGNKGAVVPRRRATGAGS